MKTNPALLNCYIASLVRDSGDEYLKSRNLLSDLAIFAVPAYGILLKCPMVGEILDLEFAAFFALLKHLTTDLKEEKVKDIQVLSSNPQFVLSFTGQLPHLLEKTERRKLLLSYGRKLNISVGLVQTFRNQAFLPLPSFPSIPPGKDSLTMKFYAANSAPEFKRFQKGIRI